MRQFNQIYRFSFNDTLVLFTLAMVTRLVGSIHYIEDIDSMRFYLSLFEFDLAKEQPHFPIYPVYIYSVKFVHLFVRNPYLTFSIVGGLTSFFFVRGTLILLRRLQISVNEWLAVIILLFNSFLWIMSNRFMPDFMGLTAVIWSFVYLRKAIIRPGNSKNFVHFFYAIGLLVGIRLSFFPLALIPACYLIWKYPKRRVIAVFSFVLAITVWITPLFFLFGFDQMWQSGLAQTRGHFLEFGGTIFIEDTIWNRFVAIGKYLWADGLGGFVRGRNVVTIIYSIVLLLTLIISRPSLKFKKAYILPLLSLGLYLIWVFFFQNILYKPRHLLPFLPFLLVVLIYVFQMLWSRNTKIFFSLFCVFVSLLMVIDYNIIHGHKKLNAIMQSANYLKTNITKDSSVALYCPDIMYKYYRLQLGDDIMLVRNAKTSKHQHFYSVSSINEPNLKLLSKNSFYHSPYVNRMWPKITIYEYKQK